MISTNYLKVKNWIKSVFATILYNSNYIFDKFAKTYYSVHDLKQSSNHFTKCYYPIFRHSSLNLSAATTTVHYPLGLLPGGVNFSKVEILGKPFAIEGWDPMNFIL